MIKLYNNTKFNSELPFEIYNIGAKSRTNVKKIAKIVLEEMNLKKTKIIIKGDKKAWPGDQPIVNFSINKAHKNGWTCQVSSDDAVKKATKLYLKKFFNMKIIVIGMWHQGVVMASCLSKYHQVDCYDTNLNNLNLLKRGILPVNETGLKKLFYKSIKDSRLELIDKLDNLKKYDVIIIAHDTIVDEYDNSKFNEIKKHQEF